MDEQKQFITDTEQKKRVSSFFGSDEEWQGGIYHRGSNDQYLRMIARSSVYNIELIRSIPSMQSGRALDVGCGSGVYFQEILHKGWTVFGMDSSGQMITASRTTAGTSSNPDRIHLLQADVEQLPYKSGTMDVILFVGVLAYLLQDDRALEEIRRVLKPDGYLLLNVTNMLDLGSLDYLLRLKLRSLLRGKRLKLGATLDSSAVRKHSPTQFHFKTYHPWRFEKVLKGCGFTFVEARTLGYELRLLRRSHLIPLQWLDRLELAMERFSRERYIPYFSYSGRRYIGLFHKDS